MGLRELLSEPERRERVIDDCCTLVDDEVSKKKGLAAVIIRAGYKAVRGIKPGFIRHVVSSLLDEWIAALEPLWQRGLAEGRAPAEHLASDPSAVAEALLSVTDGRAAHAKNALVRATYQKLRSSAKEHVEAAVPGLAELLAKHTSHGLG